MGGVGAFAVDGCELWFNSNDHAPPHFHAETDKGEVRVFFLEEPARIESKWDGKVAVIVPGRRG